MKNTLFILGSWDMEMSFIEKVLAENGELFTPALSLVDGGRVSSEEASRGSWTFDSSGLDPGSFDQIVLVNLSPPKDWAWGHKTTVIDKHGSDPVVHPVLYQVCTHLMGGSKLFGLVVLVGGALRATPEDLEGVETRMGEKGPVSLAKMRTSTAEAIIAVGEGDPPAISIHTKYASLYVEGDRFRLGLYELPSTRDEARDIAFPLFLLAGNASSALDEESRRNYELFMERWTSF